MSVSLDGFSAAGRETPAAWITATSVTALPEVVFSTSLAAVDWENAVLDARRVKEAIPRLKAEPARDIVVYRLTVHPIALGGGGALMHGLPEPQRFELVSSTVYMDGSTVRVLRPTSARRDG